MASVEDRIVRMEFDNATFQVRVAQTIKSLQDLDKALKLEGANKGFADISAAASKLSSSINFSGIHKGIADTAAAATGLDKALKLDGAKQGISDISKAAHSVDLSPIQTSIQRVSAGFLALSTIAVTTLATITQHAIAAGSNIAKALSLDGVISGFREYEQNIGSIQTILANTKAEGATLQNVTDALDLLNDYSDRTIYNFGQMARNIGTFTAAGVDLQTSVDSIKGISNLAAISGSSAEQASTAMYQLSQAISTGTLRLIDWNSVVNAGMGGEVFQKALFETGKALGTITDVPINTTFEEWTSAGNSFRDSLQDGWLTSEVLTTTLQGFTGEMTEAQLLSIGYTKEQAAAILELGQTGVEAATKIRTFSQLLSTIKETIGSGWSQSFRAVFGDFNQATELFTNINDVVGDFIKRQADARTALLQAWSDLGGRENLINDLGAAFRGLAELVAPIREAFRDIFPRTTATQLLTLTARFGDFIKQIIPAERTVENLRRIFTGLFSALDLGWEIIKAGVGFIKDLVVQVTGLGSGSLLEFAADIADFFTSLREGLDQGERVKEFFDNVRDAIQSPIDRIQNLRDAVIGLFAGLGDLGTPFLNFLQSVGTTLREVGEKVFEFFDGFKKRLADAFGIDSFDAAASGLSVGLLGGILLALKKFLDEGISLDVTGGLFDKISDALTELTGTLKALQTNLKADALMKIAIAIGILAASIVVLSLIDADKLAQALSAITVGFGQLVGAFAVLNTLSLGLFSGAKFAILAAGIAILAGALVILSGAVFILSRMSWEDIAKGLSAITLMLTVLTAAAIVISKNVGSILAASVAMIALAVGLSLLAGAVKLFSLMDWDELLHGFVGVAAGLAILAAGMRLMPTGLALQGAGLLIVAGALIVMAKAVEAFAAFEWNEIVRGLVGIGASMLVIAGAMRLMPDLILTGAGLLLVSFALGNIADAVSDFGAMSWAEIARGIVALAASLLVIAGAMKLMESSILGAVSMVIVASSLKVLAEAVQAFADIPMGDLAKGIGAIAVALLVLVGIGALAQNFAGGLLALGASILLLGAGFALFGVGIEKLAKGFQILAETGDDAANRVREGLEAIALAIPTFITNVAKGLVDLIVVLGESAGKIAEAFGKVFVAILQQLTELLPQFGEFMIQLIETILNIIVESTPRLIEAGLTILTALLQGIRDHISDVTLTVIEIIVNFLNTLAANIQLIVDAGTNVLVQFLLGIAQNVHLVVAAAAAVVVAFINEIGAQAVNITTAGADAIIDFVTGLGQNAERIVEAGVQVVLKFLEGVANSALQLANGAADVIIDFLNALADTIRNKSAEFRAAGANIASAIISGLTGGLSEKAGEVKDKLLGIAGGAVNAVKGFLGIGSPSKVFIEIGENMMDGLVIGLKDTHAVDVASKNLAKSAVSSFSTILSQISAEMGHIEDFQPRIRPVLDLSDIQAGGSRLGRLIPALSDFAPIQGFSSASIIARMPAPSESPLDAKEVSGRGDVIFEQTINAPTELSSGEIYKQTRNQITLAKEELDVP